MEEIIKFIVQHRTEAFWIVAVCVFFLQYLLMPKKEKVGGYKD
jgi:hypothetical protein